VYAPSFAEMEEKAPACSRVSSRKLGREAMVDVEVVSTAPIVRWERHKQSESMAHDGLAGTHGNTHAPSLTKPFRYFASHTHTRKHTHMTVCHVRAYQ
jgi:hypothetical protein